MSKTNPPLNEIYQALFDAWGPRHWWPGRTRFEIIVGAILTQNTAWTNVEKALINLKRHRVLAPAKMRAASSEQLAEWIRPAGYFNVKTRRLQAFVEFLHTAYKGSLNRMFATGTTRLREELLAVNGIGPETADSILLYAGNRPVFVVDAYTRRFLLRHGWIEEGATYDDIARLFTERIACDVQRYNEYHALMVNLGKDYCRPKPRCATCPLKPWLSAALNG